MGDRRGGKKPVGSPYTKYKYFTVNGDPNPRNNTRIFRYNTLIMY
jgi:hypothetical protein